MDKTASVRLHLSHDKTASVRLHTSHDNIIGRQQSWIMGNTKQKSANNFFSHFISFSWSIDYCLSRYWMDLLHWTWHPS